jgi:hypothetical protein
MMKRVMILIFSLAILVGMGLATTAALAGDHYGQIRWRWEGWNNEFDADGDEDDNWAASGLRTRLGYMGEVGDRGIFNVSIENVRILGAPDFVEFIDKGPYYEYWMWNNSAVNIHEAYFGIKDLLFEGFDGYVGRYSLSYGRERFIGPEDWSILDEHRFDGFKGHYAFEKGWFDLLCLKIMETGWTKYDSGNSGEGDTDLRGIYLHYDAAENMYIEPYIMMLTDSHWGDDSVEVGDETYDFSWDSDSYFVFGALFDYMNDSGLHFYAEGIMKSGTWHGEPYFDGDSVVQPEQDVSTMAFYAGLFYEFDSEINPFIGAEFNYASGTSADEEDWKTFEPFWGSYSNYMGIMNFVGWSNTATIRLAGGLTPVEGTDISLDFFLFKLANDEDRAYDPWFDSWSGVNVGEGDVVKYEKSVGTEIDFKVKHRVSDGLTLHGGVSIFSFGDYFTADPDGSGPGEPWDPDSVMFGYLGGEINF